MITAIKEFTFDSAHMLAGHEGLCKNVHGHTYKVHVEVAHKNNLINEGPSEGMVVDFKHMKDLFNEHLFSKLDHAFVYNTQSDSALETKIADLLIEENRKVYGMDCRPTAENMTYHFYTKLTQIKDLLTTPIVITSVKVWETPTSYAEFKPATGGIVNA